MKKELMSLFAATVLAVGVAAAADQDASPAGADAMFKSLDKDGDQRLSKSEVAQDKTLLDDFAALDADSDGYLTTREYASHSKKMKPEETKTTTPK
jgi:Ca2+-binding EF-hand superfamily protein